MIKILSTFVIISVLLLTIFSTAIRPELHKQFILTHPDFKISSLSQRPTDLQSVQMFRLGDAPEPIAIENSTPPVMIESEPKIIPSDIKIIPSDFVQTVPAGNNRQIPEQVAQPNSPQQLNNSDKILDQVEKMLNSEITPPVEQPKTEEKKADTKTPKTEEPKKEDNPLTCSICDQLKNPKIRAELIAWNKWRSDLQNRIMELSYVEAPYGTLFYFMFTVDNNRRIKNIRIISTRSNTEDDIKNIRSTIVGLNGDKILDFPKGSNRKSVTFSGGFLISDFEQFSTPSDFKDFEYVQSY